MEGRGKVAFVRAMVLLRLVRKLLYVHRLNLGVVVLRGAQGTLPVEHGHTQVSWEETLVRFERFYHEKGYDELLVGEWAQLAFDPAALSRAHEKAGNEAQAAVDAAILKAEAAGKKYNGQRSVKAKEGANMLNKEYHQTADSPFTRPLEALWDALWEKYPCVLFRFDVLYVQTGGLGHGLI